MKHIDTEGLTRPSAEDEKPKRVTMRDVAARAGVHQTTVSIALRGHNSIPPATRRKILAAATELGYEKDPKIEAFNRYRLNRRQTASMRKIAFVSDAGSPAKFMANSRSRLSYAGAQKRAEDLGMELELIAQTPRALRSKRFADEWTAAGYAGAIVSLEGEEALKFGEWSDAASFVDMAESSGVAPDYRTAAEIAVKGLHGMGYRRIGYAVSDNSNYLSESSARIGYASALREFALTPCWWSESSAEGMGAAEWAERLNLDAILCVRSDEWSERKNLEGGNGIGGTLVAPLLESGAEDAPPSCIDFRWPELGAAAVELLSEALDTSWFAGGRVAATSYLEPRWREGWLPSFRVAAPCLETAAGRA